VVLFLLVAVCAAAIFGVAVWRIHRESLGKLMTRLPDDNAVVVYVDVAALRNAHVLDALTAPAAMQEPDYRAFVDQTGFDYARDLDMALVSFGEKGTYFLLRGRFDWPFLKDYVKSEGGTCYNTFCRAQGSTPERMISFFPLERDLMALAVSKDEYAAYALQERHPARQFTPPQDPVWSLIPGGALKNPGSLPAATQLLARALGSARQVVVSAGPAGDHMELRLDVACQSASQAAELTAQLRQVTAQLKEQAARENPASGPGDVSGVLTAGTFDQKDVHVLGRWPIQRSFLDTLGNPG
jgi:hypothetical protein